MEPFLSTKRPAELRGFSYCSQQTVTQGVFLLYRPRHCRTDEGRRHLKEMIRLKSSDKA